MGDTLLFKITEKVIDLEHLSRFRYGSTDVSGLRIYSKLSISCGRYYAVNVIIKCPLDALDPIEIVFLLLLKSRNSPYKLLIIINTPPLKKQY